MRIKEEKGFTLIEVIISLLLISMIVLAVLPMSIYSARYAKWNNIKLTALNLAYTQVEWLKTLDYDDLGLNIVGYSPKGIVEENSYMNEFETVEINGVNYTIQTGIYWEGAVSTTGEPVPQAIKKIDVIVKAKDILTGEIREFSVLGSLVAREGERIPTEPGHVKVYVSLRGYNEGLKNVRVSLGQSSPNVWHAYTDDKGTALFGDLHEGNYVVQPTKWGNLDMMIMPNGVDDTNSNWKLYKQVIVPKWDKDNIPDYPEVSFNIDLPAFIHLPNDNEYPDSVIEIKPTSASYMPPEGQGPDDILLRISLNRLNEIKFWRLWEYDYTILNGEEKYFLIESDTGNLWDGRFSIEDYNQSTIEDLKLAFALEEISTFNIINNGNKQNIEFIIKFTSNVENIEAMEFNLSGELINQKDYTITQLVSGKNNAFKIVLEDSINFNEEELDFQIINTDDLINNYGMKLSKDLSRCTLVRSN